jgi:pentose-5-phosphate-3-epimerase
MIFFKQRKNRDNILFNTQFKNKNNTIKKYLSQNNSKIHIDYIDSTTVNNTTCINYL